MASKKSVRSMTGYGEARGVFEGGNVLAELWSLNHRYFEFSFHAPEGLSSWEVPFKKQVSAVLARGRVRLSVRFAGGKDPCQQLVMSDARAQEYMQFYREICARYNLKGELTADALLFAPSVVSTSSEVPDREAFFKLLAGLVDEALGRMEEMQLAEGIALKADMLSRFGRLGQLVGQVRERIPKMVEAYRKTLESKVRNWNIETQLPPERLAQEIMMFADRSDITEELVRLDSHLSQCRQALENGGEVGHRLDFLAQECSREINTAGAKAQSAEVAALVVEFKEELSKVREQLQNIV